MIIKKKSTTTFEINDENRNWETRAGSDYCDLIRDFIGSLGFDVQFQHPNEKLLFSHILIDGVEAFLYTDSASYMGQSAYTKVRKPRQNRFIGIGVVRKWDNTGLIKIPINKEIDKDKLVKRITEFVKNKLDGEKARHEQKKLEGEVVLKIRTRIQSNYSLNEKLTSISIQKGELKIGTDFGEICFDIRTWDFKCFLPVIIPFFTWDEILTAPTVAKSISNSATYYSGILKSIGSPLSESEIELTKSISNHINIK